jgi:OHCU decarboxylase
LKVTANFQTDIEQLNLLPVNEAEDEFLKCCGSKNWARQVAAARPFANVDELTSKADKIWWDLAPADWLEAFHSHPKIGEKKAAAPSGVTAQQWSEAEQSGIRDSAQQTIAELADLNRAYEEKFGFIFIVYASGKSAEEMLAILRQRMGNQSDAELRIAAAEQAKITTLRLGKLLAS